MKVALIVMVAQVGAVIPIKERCGEPYSSPARHFDRSRHVGTAVAISSFSGQRVAVSEGNLENVRPPSMDRESRQQCDGVPGTVGTHAPAWLSLSSLRTMLGNLHFSFSHRDRRRSPRWTPDGTAFSSRPVGDRHAVLKHRRNCLADQIGE